MLPLANINDQKVENNYEPFFSTEPRQKGDKELTISENGKIRCGFGKLFESPSIKFNILKHVLCMTTIAVPRGLAVPHPCVWQTLPTPHPNAVASHLGSEPWQLSNLEVYCFVRFFLKAYSLTRVKVESSYQKCLTGRSRIFELRSVRVDTESIPILIFSKLQQAIAIYHIETFWLPRASIICL